MKIDKDLIVVYVCIVALGGLLSMAIGLVIGVSAVKVGSVCVPVFVLVSLWLLHVYFRGIHETVHEEFQVIKSVNYDGIGLCRRYRNRWEFDLEGRDIELTLEIDLAINTELSGDELDGETLELVIEIKNRLEEYNALALDSIKKVYGVDSLELGDPSVTIMSAVDKELDVYFRKLNDEYGLSYICKIVNSEVMECSAVD